MLKPSISLLFTLFLDIFVILGPEHFSGCDLGLGFGLRFRTGSLSLDEISSGLSGPSDFEVVSAAVISSSSSLSTTWAAFARVSRPGFVRRGGVSEALSPL
jgi:hypothetical protein